MIKLQRLRNLDLVSAPQPGRGAFLSAASGLLLIDGKFHIIADDELGLDYQKPHQVHRPHLVAFDNLYRSLLEQLPDLNIEGCVIVGDGLKLFQRGNGPSHQNAIVSLNMEQVARDLQAKGALFASSIQKVEMCDLGDINGAHLSFTDAAAERIDRIWFLAGEKRSNRLMRTAHMSAPFSAA